jgi:hypothetical protein
LKNRFGGGTLTAQERKQQLEADTILRDTEKHLEKLR